MLYSSEELRYRRLHNLAKLFLISLSMLLKAAVLQSLTQNDCKIIFTYLRRIFCNIFNIKSNID